MNELDAAPRAVSLGQIFFGRLANLFRRRARARRSYGHPERASIRFETLESRLLLSADLVGAPLVAAGDAMLPGESAQATVLVSNIGDASTRRPVQVNLYASRDGVLDAGDLLLGSALTDSRIGAGQSQRVDFDFSLPDAIRPGDYSLISVVDPQGRIAEASEANNVGSASGFAVEWTFGERSLTVREDDGTRVTFSLSGPGTGEVDVVDGRWDVHLAGTDETSVLNVMTTGAGHRVSLDDVHVQGALGAMLAPTTDLTGELTVDGAIRAGVLLGSAHGALIEASSVNGTRILGVSVGGIAILGDVEDSAVHLTAPDASLGDFFVAGSMRGSKVEVGAEPAAKVDSITILGTMSRDSFFVAGAYPDKAFVDWRLLDTATDTRFRLHAPSAELVVYDAQSAGEYTVRRVGEELQVVRGGVVVASGLAGNQAFTFNGADGGTTLVVDVSGGNPVPAGGLVFNGGDGNDTLVLQGEGSFDAITHSFSSETSGTVTLAAGSMASQITYTGLEPIVDNLSAQDRVFTFNAGPETITLSDAAGTLMHIDSNVGGEAVDFALPTRSLTINGGTGNDIIRIASVDAALRAGLSIDGGSDLDAVNIETSLNFGGTALSTGELAVTAEMIALVNGGTIETSGSQAYSGDVALGGPLAAVFRASGSTAGITFNDALAMTRGISVSAREIDFNGGAGSVSGAGLVALDAAAGSVPIILGGAADTGPASLDLTDSDIAALTTGLHVEIGGLGAANSIIVDSSGASFGGEVRLQATGIGGTVSVLGALETSASAAEIAINAGGSVTINAPITTAGGAVRVSAHGSVTGSSSGTITTTGLGSFSVSGSVSILGRGGVAMAGDIVTRGVDAPSNGGAGNIVSISTHNQAITLGNVDTRGGSGASGTGGHGGAILITTSGAGGAVGAGSPAVTVNGSLLAGAGMSGGSTPGLSVGGSITVNGGFSHTSGPVTINGAVRTDRANVEIRGDGITVGDAIATSGSVFLRGGSGSVQLADAVTAGTGPIEISGLTGVAFDGPLSGGSVDITSSAGAVVGGAGATIVTGGNAILATGRVGIIARTGVDIAADIVTRGASSPIDARAGGTVNVSASNGPITLAGVDTRGGDSASGSGGNGGMIILQTGGVGMTAGAITVHGSLLAQAGASGGSFSPASGGMVAINTLQSGAPGLVTIAGDVSTQNANVEIRGTGLDMGGAVITGGNGAVTLHGGTGTVTLDGAVAGGTGQLQISGNAGVTFGGALSTYGGSVFINSVVGLVTGAAGAGIVTTGQAFTAQSGDVEIAGRDGVHVGGDIVTRGLDRPSGGLGGGNVRISTSNGPIELASIDTRGGDSLSGAGGRGGSIVVLTFGGDDTTTIGGSLLAQAGLSSGVPGSFQSGGQIRINDFVAQPGTTTIAGAVRTSDAAINIRGSGVTASGEIATTGMGAVTLAAGAGAMALDADVIAGGAILISADAGVTFDGALRTTHGVMQITTGGAVNANGSLDAGRNSIAFTAPGGVFVGPDAVWHLDVGGSAPGQLTIITASGSIALNGTLAAELVGGFVPAPGDRFRFLNAGLISGSFDSLQLPPDFSVEPVMATALELVFTPDDAPILAPIGAKTVNEHALLTFTALATDPDPAVDGMTYSLDAGAPAGAAIDPATGVFTWTPNEAQGPGTYGVTIRVTDDGAGGLVDFEAFSITVNEVNSAPVLAPIGDQEVQEGALLSFAAVATDDDLPAGALTYTLDAGAPAGAAIDPSTGLFTWTPDVTQGPGTYLVGVRVTDAGGMDDAETITIVVRDTVVTTARWINAAGGAWEVASNWDIGRVPGAADDVIIDMAVASPITASAPVSIDSLAMSDGRVAFDADAYINTLVQSGGTIAGSGTVFLYGASEWSGGEVAATIEVLAELSLSGTLTLHDAAFDPGQIIVRDEAQVTLAGGAVLRALGGLSGSMYLAIDPGAVLVKTGVAISEVNSVLLKNSGLVDVQAGRLMLVGGGSDTHDGTFEVDAGATLDLNVNTHDLRGNSVVRGAGALEGNGVLRQVAAGSNTLIETAFSVGGLWVNEGTMELSGSVSAWGNIIVGTGATLTISGELTNYDAATQTLRPHPSNNFASFAVAGTLRVAGADIVTNMAEVVLSGPTSQFLNHTTGGDALADLAATAKYGTFHLTEGRSFTTAGDYTNGSQLWLGRGGTLNVTGNYITDGAGLRVDIHGTAADHFGRLLVGGNAFIDSGYLALEYADGFVPAVGDSFAFMTFASRSGDFFQADLPAGTVLDASDPTSLELVVQAVILEAVHWMNPAGGSWHDAANWSTGEVPQADQNVYIDLAGSYTVEFLSGASSVHSITTGQDLLLIGGTLAVTSTLDIDAGASLILEGGTLAQADVRGTVLLSAGATGTLDAVTLLSGTVLVESSSMLSVLNGITVDGSLGVRGTGSVELAGSQTVSGTGSISVVDAASTLSASAGGVLTLLGGSLTIGGAGIIGSANSQVSNRARIVGASASGELTVHHVTNEAGGVLENSGAILIKGGLVNTGTVSLGSGNTITVDGTFTNGGPGQIVLTQTASGKVGTLQVWGDAVLDGELVIDGGLPAQGFLMGDEFEFMTFSSLTGYFASTTLINFPSDQSATVDSSMPGMLVLMIEPAAAPMAAARAADDGTYPDSASFDKQKRPKVDWNASGGFATPFKPVRANFAEFLALLRPR